MEHESTNRVTAAATFSPAWNALLKAPVSDRALRTYLVIQAYVRPGNATFPKITRVAEDYHLSESYLRRGLAELVEHGLVQVTKEHFAGGFRRVNSYHFPHLPDPVVSTSDTGPSKSDRPAPRTSDTPRCNTSDTPIEVEEVEVEEVTNKRTDGAPDGFSGFWALYPDKRNKKAAEKAYKTALKHHNPEHLRELLTGYLAARERIQKTGEFVPRIPYASTWLNGERWNDYTEATMPAATTISLSWADAL